MDENDPVDIDMTPRSKAVITMSWFLDEEAEAGFISKSRQACLPGTERGGQRGFNGRAVSVWEDEKAREKDGGVGCTTV